MTVAIFNPSVYIRDRYHSDKDIVYFNSDGWWVIENGRRICIDLSNKPKDFSGQPNVHEIIDSLREYGPLWSRWMARGDQYELYYREALFDVIDIIRGLKLLNVDIALFNSGVTHHISTVILEVACKFANVKQVFLYTNNIMLGRLLPLIQERSISDRRVLITQSSKYPAEFYIERFIKNKLSGGTPEVGGALPSSKEKSFTYALWLILLRQIKNYIRPIKTLLKPFNDKKKHFFYRFYDFSSPDLFRSVIQQRNALRFHNNKIVKTEELANRNDHKLLIAAHFQPEATSFPEGSKRYNHIDIVLELRNKGFKDTIYYKEHPASYMFIAEGIDFTRVGMARSVSYYKQLASLGCVFLSAQQPLALNQENSDYLPVTITGTIALERSLAGLRTIITGYPWYSGLPGTIHISEIDAIDSINPDWLISDSKIARDARVFLCEILSNNTITNALGFGSDKVTGDGFAEEFDGLIEVLKTNKVNPL